MNFIELGEWLLQEADYKGALGFTEIMRFMAVASEDEKQAFNMLTKQNRAKDAWELVQRVTGMGLSDDKFNK